MLYLLDCFFDLAEVLHMSFILAIRSDILFSITLRIYDIYWFVQK